jgi:2-deoxy-D-gluconate 3-dehydrogenase
MILDAFSLANKVAIVTGCDTGLGQGMALGLAEAGCHIVGVGRKRPQETAEQVTAMGRKFLAIQADLGNQDCINDIVSKTVSQLGRIDILLNNAGTIRRCDALEFSEKDWDDVMNLNVKTVFFSPRPSPASLLPRATAGKSLILLLCSRFRAESACRRIRRPKVGFSD